MPTKGRTMRFKKGSALLIALTVVGAACGSDSKSGDTGAPATNAPGATTGATTGGTSGGSASGGTLVIATDLPLQGASHDASTDTNNAIKLIIEQAGITKS